MPTGIGSTLNTYVPRPSAAHLRLVTSEARQVVLYLRKQLEHFRHRRSLPCLSPPVD